MRHVIALYDNLQNPEQLRRELEGANLAPTAIRISSEGDGAAEARTTTREPRGFMDWLFGVPEEDATYYREGVARGRTLVTVNAQDGDLDRINAILERYNPVDIDTERAGAGAGAATGAEEARIPLAEEELKVGKRQVQGGGVRVRSYVVEQPVEGEVTLRDEDVRVERRPASGAAGNAGDAFRERSVEIAERHEEPVVEKTARVKEEVVVSKDVQEHTEQVRDKVRRTEVEVEDTRGAEPAGTAPRRR